MRLQTLEQLKNVNISEESERPIFEAVIKAGYEPQCIGNGVLYNKPNEWIYSLTFSEKYWINILFPEKAPKCTASTHVGWLNGGFKGIYRPIHELEEGWVRINKMGRVNCRPHKLEDYEEETPLAEEDIPFFPLEGRIKYYRHEVILDADSAIVLGVRETSGTIIAKFFNLDCSALGVASGISGGGMRPDHS